MTEPADRSDDVDALEAAEAPVRPRRRRLLWAGLLIGLGLVIGLVAWQGVGDILAVLTRGGWALLLVILTTPLILVPNSFAWQILFAPGRRPPFGWCLFGNWIAQSINNLLPVAMIGGDAVKARILITRGVPGTEAAGSVIADKAAQAVAMVMMMVCSTAILALVGARWPVVLGAGGISVAAGISVWIFVVLQRRGMFAALARPIGWMFRRHRERIKGSAATLDQSIRDVHTRPGRFLLAGAIRLLGVILHGTEIWIATQVMGLDFTILDAVLLRLVATAVRSAAFFVWGGMGVQEGAFVLLGGVLGGTPEVMLAMSFAIRVRELGSGIPALVAWQFWEVRRALRR